MNNGGSHYPFHGHNNSVNHMQRFREEPQLRLGALGQPPFQALPAAYASSSYAQPLVQCLPAHAYHPGNHQEAGRRPAHHEPYVGGARSPGAAQPAQESRPRIFEGSPSFQAMAGHGHLPAAQQMEVQRRQLEENPALGSLLLLTLSCDSAGVVPSPRNQAQVVANGGLEHWSSSSARGGDGIPYMPLPAPSNTPGESSSSARPQQPRLVDYMGVQGVRVALGDVKTMVGSLRGTLFDARTNQGETNGAMNLDLTLGCSEIIDLTLRL